MRRRDKAGGKAGKAQHRKTLARRDVRKAVRRRRRGSVTEQETEVTQLRRELQEALQQQTATADVLKVISNSPGELAPIFNAILQNAVRICDAKFAHLWLREGNSLRIGGTHGAPDAFVAYLRDVPVFRPKPETGLGQLLRMKQLFHLADITSLPTYGDKLREATIKFARARSLIGVPMIKDGEVIGAIVIYRREVRSFTDKQIELVQNFAAQAVIAIENTRLLNELRKSLQQQTATADVLKVISSSQGELEPVFAALLENATRICEATFGNLSLYNGETFQNVALHNPPTGYAERGLGEVIRPHPESGLAYVARTKQLAHIDDIRTQPPYHKGDPAVVGLADVAGARTLLIVPMLLKGDPAVVGLADVAGARTLLIVPMLKESTLVGTIAIYRQEIKPFTDKQIELVQNFAAQAVIAIENTRLLSELRESLQQQTATADVLKVISRSTFDLQDGAQYVGEISEHSSAKPTAAAIHGARQETLSKLVRQLRLSRPNLRRYMRRKSDTSHARSRYVGRSVPSKARPFTFPTFWPIRNTRLREQQKLGDIPQRS